ncbi:YfcL family protein [Shewanella subflava]|uniref:YfcL family protein n=1 Tax=Shewanella subflava TaxID=2986476 RepID=A0ABT3I506_9GAMM|nr:YfcL family protein [Shewanella subflava]MCW3171146.1 YfcL family protein [Shewanella subflava]
MLEKYDAAMESWIKETVSNGDDDALFASGYLQGHIAVVLAKLEAQADQGLDALDHEVIQCLALANEELNDADYVLVAKAWQQLRSRIVEAVS